MTAVIPSGASPGSGFSVPLDEDEEAQSWMFIESVSADAGSFDGSGSGEIVFPAASPSIISQESWNIVRPGGGAQQQMRAFTTPSPVMSQPNANLLSTSPFSGAAAFGTASTTSLDHADGAMVFDFASVSFGHQQQQQHQQQQHQQQQHQQQAPQHQFVPEALLSEQVDPLAPHNLVYTPQDLLVSGLSHSFDAVPMMPFDALNQQAPFAPQLDIPSSMQGTPNVGPWDPTCVQQNSHIFVSEQFTTPPPMSVGSSISLSPRSPSLPAVKQDARGLGKRGSTHANQSTSKKPAGVQKAQKRKASTSPRSASDSPDGRLKDGILMFCNQTVDTWGKPNFGDVENIERSSQKGRKGALSEEVRANALKVRQTGACFCCHIRKVKCDEERPCKNCVKLCAQVSGVVCWKFPDFTEILLPEFLRRHFRRDEMARFVADNVASFTVDGAEVPCRVALSSGPGFGARLVVNAKVFTARDARSEVNQHWYHFLTARGGVSLDALPSAPVGLDLGDQLLGGGSQRGELRRKVEAYVDALVAEPCYAAQVTDSLRRTPVPRRVLALVQRYAARAGEAGATARRALAIYAMHYVMTRHLTMTAPSVAAVQRASPAGAAAVAAAASASASAPTPAPARTPYLTPRLLNRQIKTVVDDLMQHEISALFDDFTKRFKGKDRRQWAPCLAAFLVFCLLMEAIEAATDIFAITGTEIEMRNGLPVVFRRPEAMGIIQRIEDMPFKQFAFQFHHIFQTHSRDASARSFNPLCGDELNDLADLDPAAVELVLELRHMLQADWNELDWLVVDPFLSDAGGHPYPVDMEEDYTGRLVAKFLLSFQNPSYIFASA